MKMVAARKYKHDYSDVFGIIKENKSVSFDKIETAIKELYGEVNVVSDDMMAFVKDVFNGKQLSNVYLEKEETIRPTITKVSK